MEVTANNFEDLLPEIEDSIDRCEFLAIGCELSGPNVTDEDNCFETVEDVYLDARTSASEFLVVKFGLCPFFYDPAKDEYTHEGYNFYTFPRKLNGKGLNARFLCQASSMQFLASSGDFDFNKLIYQGIPYLSYANENKMKAEVEKRFEQYASDENSDPLSIPASYKRFLDSIEAKIHEFLYSWQTEMTFDRVSAFQRKLIFNHVKPKYSNWLYFESALQEVDEEYVIPELDTSLTEVDEANTSLDEDAQVTPTRAIPKVRVIRVYKLNKEDQVAWYNEKKRFEMESIEVLVGFARIIRKMSQSGKVIVGHNMLLEVCHTIHQFLDVLPDNLAEFKQMVRNTFPNLIDTKYMATSHAFRDQISSEDIRDSLMQFMEEPFNLPPISSVIPEKGYDFDEEKSHEAGYDAFMAGCSFIAMCQHLGTLQNPNETRVLPNSPLVMPFLNKLYMMRNSDGASAYLNISGTDLAPSRPRPRLFFVTCPEDAKLKNIQELFNQFGCIKTHWRNDTSLFVALCDEARSGQVMEKIEHRPGYRVMTFDDYQKRQMEEKKPPPLNESSEKLSVVLKKQVRGVITPPRVQIERLPLKEIPERAGGIFKKLVGGVNQSPPKQNERLPLKEIPERAGGVLKNLVGGVNQSPPGQDESPPLKERPERAADILKRQVKGTMNSSSESPEAVSVSEETCRQNAIMRQLVLGQLCKGQMSTGFHLKPKIRTAAVELP